MRFLRKLLESYLVVLLAAMSIGLAFPHIGLAVSPLTTIFLQIIFFLSSLKFDVRQMKQGMSQIRPLLFANLYMLILLPAAVYAAARFLAPQFAVALMLLAAMPAGMTSMLLTELVGGSVSYALILTMTTSLLAPVTVPLVVKFLAGASVTMSAVSMFGTLLNIIVAPFLLAQIVRYFAREKIKATFFTFKPISLFLLGLIILSVVSQQADQIIHNIFTFVPALAALAVFFIILHFAGYYGFPRLGRPERLATVVCLTYMNFTLAIYLAGRFFPDPNILIPVVLSVFPWSVGMVVFKAVVNYKRKEIS